jgi:hypothetical protein
MDVQTSRSEMSDNQRIESLSRPRRRLNVLYGDAFMRIPEIFAECDLQGFFESRKPGIEILYRKLRIRKQKNDPSPLHFLHGILYAFFMPFAMCYHH